MKQITLLALTLFLSSEVLAAPKCSSFLRTTDTPVARLSFSSGRNKTPSITMSRKQVLLSKAFTTKFLTGLESFFSVNSTTTSRLEERAVITESEAMKLMDNSGLNFVPRDEKNYREDFTTITTLSGKIIMESDADVAVSAKLRTRKYFSHDPGETDVAEMTPVLGKVSSLEIKVSNVASVNATGFSVVSQAVFKPLVFIQDAELQKLYNMSPQNLAKRSVQKKIIEKIYALEIDGEKKNPDLKQVEQFVKALSILLTESPNLFEVQTVIANSRDSFKATSPEGAEYQLTLDRNIRIYEPDADVDPADSLSYLNRTPLHTVESGLVFAELKAPQSEKESHNPVYQKLSNALFAQHRAAYTRGKGKHTLATEVRARTTQTTLSEQLYTEGTLYYLIKGVGNMPTTPKKNALSFGNEWSIALPVEIANEKHRLILEYGSLGTDGERGGILNSIGLVDSLGRDVNLESQAIKEIINRAIENEKPSTITINRQALTFPGRVDSKTLVELKEFFAIFKQDLDKTDVSTREIDDIHPINNKAQLDAYTRKIKFWNKVQFVTYQIKKYLPPAIIFGAITFAATVGANKYLTTPEQTYSTSQKLRGEESINLIIKGEAFERGFVGQVLPNGDIQILPIEPSTAVTPPTLSVDIGVIKKLEADSNKAESALIILKQQ